MDKLFTENNSSFKADGLFIPEDPILDLVDIQSNDTSSDVLATVSEVLQSNIDKEILKMNQYSYREFLNSVIPSFSLGWKHYSDTTFDLGYYGGKNKKHDIIIGCHNIMGIFKGKKKDRILLQLMVPVKDILDIEDPAIIEYIRLHNSYIDSSPDRPNVFKLQVEKAFDSFNYRRQPDNKSYWTTFAMELGIHEFMW